MLILPIYDYCDHIYFPLGANSTDTLQKLQNTALRSIVRAEPRTPIDNLHMDAQLPQLADRRRLHIAEQMYNFVHGKCPQSCTEMFTNLNDHRIRTTRSENEDLLFVPKRRLALIERGIHYFGVVIWNSIPDHIRMAPTREIFKSQLCQFSIWSIQNLKSGEIVHPICTSSQSYLTYIWDETLSLYNSVQVYISLLPPSI